MIGENEHHGDTEPPQLRDLCVFVMQYLDSEDFDEKLFGVQAQLG